MKIQKTISHRTRRLSHVHHVHVGAEAHVVREVPTWIVRIFVDHDRIRAPDPVAAILDVGRSNAEVPSVKPEARGTAAGQAILVAAAEGARETTVLPRMFHVISGVSTFMSDPFPIAVDMRRFGVAGLIAIIPTRCGLVFWMLLRHLLVVCGSGLM